MHPVTADEWDERYRTAERLFSGNPNIALVAETSGLPPGRALDVGCGEGADAAWLDQRGWQVTATDISAVAIERARSAFDSTAVTWVRTDLVEARVGGVFDLVSVFYFPMARSDTIMPRHLLDAVAPGGRLLFVSHEMEALRNHGHFDPDDFWQPADIAALLDSSWTVEVHETRPRPPVGSPDAPHVEDVVLVARRGQGRS
ncbi:MAG TPA: methyltransferase domain-containing protein [Aldersonia sp.]